MKQRGMKVATATLVSLWALGACGGGSSSTADPAAPGSSSASSTSSEPADSSTPSSSAPAEVPKVDIRTSCRLIFPGDGSDGPLNAIAPVWTGKRLTSKIAADAEEAIEDIRDIEASAQTKLSAQLEVVVTETNKVLHPTEPSVDTSAYQAAGLEVARLCGGF